MARENNKWVKMARSAKTQSEVKNLLESIEDAMKARGSRSMSKDMSDALDILVGIDTKGSYMEDYVPQEFLENLEDEQA
jgi:hypothetical protein